MRPEDSDQRGARNFLSKSFLKPFTMLSLIHCENMTGTTHVVQTVVVLQGRHDGPVDDAGKG